MEQPFERVEHLIGQYMKRYELRYWAAIDMMIEDLERAKHDAELKTDSEEDAKS